MHININKDTWLEDEIAIEQHLRQTPNNIDFELDFRKQIIQPLVKHAVNTERIELPSIPRQVDKEYVYKEMAQSYVYHQILLAHTDGNYGFPIETVRIISVISPQSDLYRMLEKYYGSMDTFAQNNKQWLRIRLSGQLKELDNCFWAIPESKKDMYKSLFPDFYDKLNLEARIDEH